MITRERSGGVAPGAGCGVSGPGLTAFLTLSLPPPPVVSKTISSLQIFR